MSSIRTIIADPHEIFLRGEEWAIKKSPEIQLVATASSGKEVIDLLQAEKPDVAVLEMRFPDLPGTEILAQTCELKIPVLFLTVEYRPRLLLEAVLGGARGYLLKSSQFDLVEVVQQVGRGEIVLCRESREILIQAIREHMIFRAERAQLSLREREVLTLIGEGYSQTQAAAQLNLSPSTVKNHMRHLMTKLGVRNQAAAVNLANDYNMIPFKHE